MQFINTIKEMGKNTKEWIVEHKELLLTDAAILAGCAGAIGVAVAVSKNEDKKAANDQSNHEMEYTSEEEEQSMIDTTTDGLDDFRNNDEPVEETINEEVEA